MELWVKCEHGALHRHGVPPEGTRPGRYVPASSFTWCEGPTEANLGDVHDWVKANHPDLAVAAIGDLPNG